MIAQRKITGETSAQASECLSGAAGSERHPAYEGPGRLGLRGGFRLPRAVRQQGKKKKSLRRKQFQAGKAWMEGKTVQVHAGN